MCGRRSGALAAVLMLAVAAPAWAGRALVRAVDSVGMTVSDMDRSVRFFTDVLTFEPVSDVELAGEQYEHLEGVFGLRMRVVRLRLGDEAIELAEYLAPRGRPVPLDARSNDCSAKNESMTWAFRNARGTIVVRQLTGAIARRIVGWSQVGDELRRGERFGMIRFGSRTEVYLPLHAQVLVKVGDRVKGGATVIARLGQ